MLADFDRRYLSPEPAHSGTSASLSPGQAVTPAHCGQEACFQRERDVSREAWRHLRVAFHRPPICIRVHCLVRQYRKEKMAWHHCCRVNDHIGRPSWAFAEMLDGYRVTRLSHSTGKKGSA